MKSSALGSRLRLEPEPPHTYKSGGKGSSNRPNHGLAHVDGDCAVAADATVVVAVAASASFARRGQSMALVEVLRQQQQQQQQRLQ